MEIHHGLEGVLMSCSGKDVGDFMVLANQGDFFAAELDLVHDRTEVSRHFRDGDCFHPFTIRPIRRNIKYYLII